MGSSPSKGSHSRLTSLHRWHLTQMQTIAKVEALGKVLLEKMNL